MNCHLLSDNEIEIITESPAETELLGFIFGGSACSGVTLLLYGELGVGKTLFTKGIGRALGIGKIKSPSFIIVSEHEGRLPLAHADLYRLDDAVAADELDLESYIDDAFLLVVEWSERWHSAPETETIKIMFEQDGNELQKRKIRIKAAGKKAEGMLRCLLINMGESCK